MGTDLRIQNAATLSALIWTEKKYFKKQYKYLYFLVLELSFRKRKDEIQNLVNIKPFTMGTDLSMLDVAALLALMWTEKIL